MQSSKDFTLQRVLLLPYNNQKRIFFITLNLDWQKIQIFNHNFLIISCFFITRELSLRNWKLYFYTNMLCHPLQAQQKKEGRRKVWGGFCCITNCMFLCSNNFHRLDIFFIRRSRTEKAPRVGNLWVLLMY